MAASKWEKQYSTAFGCRGSLTQKEAANVGLLVGDGTAEEKWSGEESSVLKRR